jgi:hypothetical protein
MPFPTTQSVGLQGPPGRPGLDGAGSEGANVLRYGAVGDGVADDTAAVQAAFDSGKGSVYFPAGVYNVGALTASAAGLCVDFSGGASLLCNSATSVLFSGVRQRIQGLTVTISAASEASFNAVEVRGASSRLTGALFNVNADIPNASLLKLTGARSTARNVFLVGQGKSFKYGAHIATVADGQLDSVRIEGFDVDVGDDGEACTYGALVYLKGLRCQINDIAFDGGLNAFFPDGLVIIDGVKNAMNTPKLFAWNATYGVNRLLNSEFFRIIGGHIQGRNNGTYVAGSIGVRCAGGVGASGHLKMVDVNVTGWENGVSIQGSHDTPTFVGCALVNNQKYALVIDGGQARGLTLIGCYLADVYGEGCIWFKDGLVEGCSISGCEIGYQEIGFYVEDAFGTLEGMVVQGCYINGGLEGATAVATMRPGLASSNTLFSNNKRPATAGALGTGPYATKAIDLLVNPTFTGATIGATGLKIGTDGNAITKHVSQTNTANYASVLTAGAHYDLTFTLTGALTSDTVHATVAHALASRAGIMFNAWVSAPDEVTLRAYNSSGSTLTSASGSVRFDVWRH